MLLRKHPSFSYQGNFSDADGTKKTFFSFMNAQLITTSISNYECPPTLKKSTSSALQGICPLCTTSNPREWFVSLRPLVVLYHGPLLPRVPFLWRSFVSRIINCILRGFELCGRSPYPGDHVPILPCGRR